MTPSQRLALSIGLALAVLACLFPAWKLTTDLSANGAHVHRDLPAGFRFVAAPPSPSEAHWQLANPNVWSVNVDTSRTALVVLAVLGLTGITTLTLRRGAITN